MNFTPILSYSVLTLTIFKTTFFKQNPVFLFTVHRDQRKDFYNNKYL